MAEAEEIGDRNDRKEKPTTSLQIRNENSFRPRTDSDLVQRVVNEILSSGRNYNSDSKVVEKIEELNSILEKIDKAKKNDVSHFGTKSTRMREDIDNLSSRFKDRYKTLLKLVEKWKPKREAAIEKLNSFIDKLDWNSKASTIVRLVSSTVDVSGSIGGLLLRSEDSWAVHAFNAASFFGLCGLVSTVAEVEMSKRILDEVSDIIEGDHKLLVPVVRWFEDTEALDSAVQEMFPCGIDKSIVQEIQEDSKEQDEYMQIFKAVLLSNVRSSNLSNKDFLHSLQLFARSEVAPLWWNRIMYRRHPILLDSSRIALQMEFGQIESIIFQCIPALPLEQQRLGSLPVAGRIMLNLLTMYDSLADLNKETGSMHSEKLRRQVDRMREELRLVEDTVSMIRKYTSEDGGLRPQYRSSSV